MNRAYWQLLAEERVNDAKVLMDSQRWSAAYYLIGYAVECSLKSCVLAYVENNADVVFRDRKYSDKCWTHDIADLVELADLGPRRLADATANPILGGNWSLAQQWNENVRYQQKSEMDARGLYGAVNDNVNGVLPWIKTHW